MTTTARAAASLAAVVTVAALVAAISLAAAVDALSHVRKVALRAASKAVQTTTVLTHPVAIVSSHVKALLAAISVTTEVLAKAVARLVATLAKAPHAAISVPHVALKTAHHAVSMTVPQHVAHVPHLKQVAHLLTSQLALPQANRLVAVLMPRSAHPNPAHPVN